MIMGKFDHLRNYLVQIEHFYLQFSELIFQTISHIKIYRFCFYMNELRSTRFAYTRITKKCINNICLNYVLSLY